MSSRVVQVMAVTAIAARAKVCERRRVGWGGVGGVVKVRLHFLRERAGGRYCTPRGGWSLVTWRGWEERGKRGLAVAV